MFNKKADDVAAEPDAAVQEPPEFPRKPGTSGSGTTHAYSVEARYMFSTPKKFGDTLLDQRWQRLHFVPSHIGVPDGPAWNHGPRACGLLGYSAAQALRWWFHAVADTDMMGGLCLETRIIKHAVQYSHSETAESAHMVISGEDRSNCIPDRKCAHWRRQLTTTWSPKW